MDYSTQTRFEGKYVIAVTGCWEWTARKDQNGYGLFWDGNRSSRAHRVSYEMHVGKIPDGLVIDHLCRVRSCVNPAHLEPVTNRENLMRGQTLTAVNAGKTHCPRGHEYTEENTLIRNNWRYGTSERICRPCRAEVQRGYRARKTGSPDSGSDQ